MHVWGNFVIFFALFNWFVSLNIPVGFAAPIKSLQISQIASESVFKSVLGVSTSLSADEQAAGSAHVTKGIAVLSLDKTDYNAGESVLLTISNPDKEDFKTEVIDPTGKNAEITVQETFHSQVSEIRLIAGNQFLPGKYNLVITDSQGKKYEHYFTWGIIAVNFDKPVYSPNSNAKIVFSVLGENGSIRCDGYISVKITNAQTQIVQNMTVENGYLHKNADCSSKELQLRPDYNLQYPLAEQGIYPIVITAVIDNKTYVFKDNLLVKNEISFIIERDSTTRIYPPKEYSMHINITANEDFKGTITETVPQSFTITRANSNNSYDSMHTLYLDENKNPEQILSKEGLKLVRPFDGTYAISQGYGMALTDNTLSEFYAKSGLSGHDGIDFALPENTMLYAVDEGDIIYAGKGDYGITIVIEHTWGKSYYGHLSLLKVEKGYHVQKGAHIGFSGNSGESTGAHLHFGMKPNNADQHNGYGGKIDPLPFLGLDDPNLNNKLFGMTFSNTVLSSSDAAEPELDIKEDEIQIASPSSFVQEHMPSLNTFQVSDEIINKSVAIDQPDISEKVKIISWNVDLKKGEKKTLAYTFKASEQKEMLNLLGPLKFFDNQDNGVNYEENRTWQIAAEKSDLQWLSSDWKYRKKLLINNSKISAELINFPVLISIPADSSLAQYAKKDGSDIVFTDASGKINLPYEIEKFSSIDGQLIAWVRVTNLSPRNDNEIYMYYGNVQVFEPKTSSDLWMSNYSAVWHMDDIENKKTLDSTTDPANASGSGEMEVAPGKIGSSLNFNGKDSVLNAGSVTKLNDLTQFTISGWVNPRTRGEYMKGRFLQKNADVDSTKGWQIYFDDVSSGGINFNSNYSDGNLVFDTHADTLSFKSWHYLTLTWDGTQTALGVHIYVDGKEYMSSTLQNASGTRTKDTNEDLLIGNSNSSDRTFDGLIDEVRISNAVRSKEWIETEFVNQNSPATFSILGNQETQLPENASQNTSPFAL